MEKAYNHTQSEEKIYNLWEKSGIMRADETSDKPPFTIPLPPPNVTGNLHLGHAAMLAIQDILTRYKKMKGYEVLWLPGTDHAAIATENVVLKHLGAKSREEYSREEFLGHCKDFASVKHDNIVNQMKRMGSWLDWSREAYTFDDERNFAVNKIFKDLYNDGLIERGYRMINWSVGAQSVLADDELEFEEKKAPFYYIRCGEFIIGTVRSETKCANSPLMLHPEAKYIKIQNKNKSETFIISEFLFQDAERFNLIFNQIPENHEDFEIIETYLGKDLEGQKFEYETYAGPRKFEVLCDAKVIDPEKGSGSMTISPNHSPEDYDLAKRLKLDEYFLEKINFEGKMTKIAGECEGFSVAKTRNVSAKIMKEKGLLVGIDENYKNRVPLCYRSGCVVEPMISPQWFVMVEKEYKHAVDGKTTLKKQMQNAIREEGNVQIIPDRFNKEYFRWIDNLQDWCISRQIWWGHRIPVWYDEDGKIVATGELSDAQKKLNLRQDEDTLDTWFSSALWPFSTLGWPNEKAPDFEKFYNNSVNGQGTDVLETGWDILFFWVARMIMFGRYATGKYPFHTAYLHGMVTDEKGKKMSKSKGNGIDPLIMIEQFGADPVRLALVIGSSPGNNIPIGEKKIKGYRNFVNKLWNAGRFVQMNNDSNALEIILESEIEPKNLVDKWILSRLSKTIKTVENALEKYDISQAGNVIYHFVWDEFCNWYLEASKVEQNPKLLTYIYQEILKLTHPLCPFVTEEIWKELFGGNFIIQEDFPILNIIDEKSEESFELIQNIVTEIRSVRADNKLNPKEKISVKINISEKNTLESLNKNKKLIINLALLSNLEIAENISKPENSVNFMISGIEVFVEIPFDAEKEKEKNIEKIESLKNQIKNLKGRLSNKSYTDKAPEKLVQQTRNELENAEKELASLEG